MSPPNIEVRLPLIERKRLTKDLGIEWTNAYAEGYETPTPEEFPYGGLGLKMAWHAGRSDRLILLQETSR